MKIDVDVKDLISIFCEVHNLNHKFQPYGDSFQAEMVTTSFEKNLINIKSKLAVYINKCLKDGASANNHIAGTERRF